MRSHIFVGLSGMTDGTLFQWTILALQGDEFYGIVLFAAWCNGMGAVVACFAVSNAVSL